VRRLAKSQHCGQYRGFTAGANVMTINFTPDAARGRYLIYGRERPHRPDWPAPSRAGVPRPGASMNSDQDLIKSLAEAGALSTREEAAAWLHSAGLLAAEAGLTNSEHAALLRLREAVQAMLAARAGGRQDAEAAARLTRALADGRLVLTVDATGAPELASAARSSYPAIVAAFAIAWSQLRLV
jgi:Putative stress-induced transcription regulator